MVEWSKSISLFRLCHAHSPLPPCRLSLSLDMSYTLENLLIPARLETLVRQIENVRGIYDSRLAATIFFLFWILRGLPFFSEPVANPDLEARKCSIVSGVAHSGPPIVFLLLCKYSFLFLPGWFPPSCVIGTPAPENARLTSRLSVRTLCRAQPQPQHSRPHST